ARDGDRLDDLVLVEDLAMPGRLRQPHHELQEHSASAPALRSKQTGTPAPGQYVWQDNVHLREKPVWSMTSPDRKSLDLMLPTWTPASSSLQPRAPDPGEYSAECGRRGVFFSPKWSQARSSGRPCLAPEPPELVELENRVPSSFGGENPLQAWSPKWSVMGKDRSQLPHLGQDSAFCAIGAPGYTQPVASGPGTT
ncbi:unnamed protein product, partial [Effrenium voratum]